MKRLAAEGPNAQYINTRNDEIITQDSHSHERYDRVLRLKQQHFFMTANKMSDVCDEVDHSEKFN